jgi:butyryl-CoA dehydrogenase
MDTPGIRRTHAPTRSACAASAAWTSISMSRPATTRCSAASTRDFRWRCGRCKGGRVAIAAQALGIGEAALDEALAYAKQREQFGQPIGNYQAIQWMLADMATELAAARMLTLKAAAAKDRQEKSTVEASMAKLAASEAGHKAADKAMQILASAGYRRGSVVERLFRDVRATEIYQGTSEAQRMIIAANVLANA